MNKEVEQRIVEMQFNNAEFESKVQQSLNTLHKLKESTKMEDAGKGMENLAKSARQVDLSSIESGVDQLNSRFSNLGIVGITVMQRIANAAMDMGQQIASAITAAPKDGWKEYELNLDSVKTILNSARDANGLPVTLDMVNEKLAELNAYSDKTIYSFSDMTSNIGKFTNAGVDLDSAVTAIQGVANVAALSGANANDAARAMYNFGQALGSGSVKLIDWKSIENANMATVDFKEQLIQTAVELGTLNKEGDKYVSTTTNMQGKVSDAFDATQGFNDSLSAQWMTADVLTKTLAKYTDETTELGQAAIKAATEVTTFSKLIDTLKESMGSGWMQTWQYIFGDFEESKQVWTAIYRELDGIIQRVSGARNAMLEEWSKAGGRNDLIEGLGNIWKAITSVARPINDAWRMIFPRISATGLVELTKGFKEFTANLILPREEMNHLRIVFKGFFTLLGAGIQTIKAVAKTVLPPVVKVFSALGRAVGYLVGGFLKWVATLTSAIQEGDRIYNIIQKLLIPIKILWKVLVTIKDVLKTAFNLTKDGLKQADGALKSFFAILKQIANAVGPVVVYIFTAMSNALASLGNNAKKAFDNFKENKIGKGLITRLKILKQAFEGLPMVIRTFGRELAKGKNPFEILKSKLFEKALYNSGFAGIIIQLRKDFKSLEKVIKSFLSSLKDGTLFYKLTENLGKGFDTLTEKLKGIKVIGPIIDKLEGILKKFKDVTGGIGTAISTFILNVTGKVKKIDFTKVGVFALLGSISMFLFRWSKVGKNASFALKALGKFILNGGKIAQTAVDKYNGFLKIAAAIGIIAGSIWLLSKVPADRFREICLTLGAAFLAMFGAITILSVMKIPEDKIKAIGIAFGGLGVGFLAVAAAAKILATMEWPEIGKAAVALVGFTALVVAAARLAGGAGVGTGVAFLGLSGALLMLLPSIKILATMKTETLVKGGLAVYAFTKIMCKAIKETGQAKGSFGAFMGLSLGLMLLIPSIKMLAGMDLKTLAKGGVAVYAFLKMMSKAAKEAGEGNAKGFLGMGIAILVIAGALKIMESIKWSSLMASTIALENILQELTMALVNISKVNFSSMVKSVFAMAACLGVVVGTLYIMDNYMKDSDATLKNAVAVSAILFAFSKMGPAITMLSKVPFEAGVTAAGNAMVFFGAVAICIGALGELSLLTKGAAGDAMSEGASIIGRVIHNFVKSLITGDSADKVNVVENMAESLSSFGSKIQGFLNALMNTDIAVVDKAKSLAIAILAICGAELLEAITSWISGKKDVESFAEMLGPLTDAIVEMNEKLASVTIDGNKLDQIASVVTSFSEVAKAIPRTGGLADKILGVRDLSDFADEMSAFVLGGFRKFVRYVNGLGDSLGMGFNLKVMQITSATQAMADLANNLPRSGGWADAILGVKDLSDFAKEMSSFMRGEDGFKGFVKEVNGAEPVNLLNLRGNIIPATDEMLKLASKLTGQGNVITNFITGKQDLSQFGSKLAAFGAGLKDFATNIAGITPTNIDGITASAERLAALNASENLTYSNLGTFSSSINSLGGAIKVFTEDTSTTSPEMLAAIIDKLTSLHNLLLIISGTDYSGVSNFADALKNMGKSSVAEFLNGFSEASASATQIVTGLINSITGAIEANFDQFRTKGGTVVLEFCAGMKANDGFLTGAGISTVTKVTSAIDANKGEFNKKGTTSVLEFCSGISKNNGFLKGAGISIVAHAIDGIKSVIGQFYDQGGYSAEGYRKGIRDKADDVAQEAADMARNALAAVKEVTDSHSPSKEYEKEGNNDVEGYALGFVKNVSKVVRAAKSVGKAGLDTMGETVGKMKALLDGSLDYKPTITPVVDLTNVRSGIQQATGLLNGIELASSGLNAAIDISRSYNDELARRSQAKSFDYTGDLGTLISNTSKLISAVKENRYAVIDGEYVFDYVDRKFGEA